MTARIGLLSTFFPKKLGENKGAVEWGLAETLLRMKSYLKITSKVKIVPNGRTL